MGLQRHLAILTAAFAHFCLGAVWYSVFQKPWLAGIGKTMEQLARDNGRSVWPYAIGFAAIWIMCYVLAWLMLRLSGTSLAAGARTGAAVGFGIAAMQLALNDAFEWRPPTLWLINGGYATVGLLVAGAIIGGWRRARVPDSPGAGT